MSDTDFLVSQALNCVEQKGDGDGYVTLNMSAAQLKPPYPNLAV